MDFVGTLARTCAELQWALDHPQEQFLLDNPHRDETALDFEKDRAAWLTEQSTLWMSRFKHTGDVMAKAETVACALAIILFLEDSIDSRLFSHWYDIAAIPLLVFIDQLRAYVVKDASDTPETTANIVFLFVARLIMVLSGFYFGFLFPFLVAFTIILCLFIVPFAFRRAVTAFRYF